MDSNRSQVDYIMGFNFTRKIITNKTRTCINSKIFYFVFGTSKYPSGANCSFDSLFASEPACVRLYIAFSILTYLNTPFGFSYKLCCFIVCSGNNARGMNV